MKFGWLVDEVYLRPEVLPIRIRIRVVSTGVPIELGDRETGQAILPTPAFVRHRLATCTRYTQPQSRLLSSMQSQGNATVHQ